MLDRIQVWRSSWLIHTLNFFSIKHTFHKPSWMRCGVIIHEKEGIDNGCSVKYDNWSQSLTCIPLGCQSVILNDMQVRTDSCPCHHTTSLARWFSMNEYEIMSSTSFPAYQNTSDVTVKLNRDSHVNSTWLHSRCLSMTTFFFYSNRVRYTLLCLSGFSHTDNTTSHSFR